jgi:hypothetical protein
VTVYRGQVTLVDPSGKGEEPVAAAVEPGETALSIAREGRAPVELAYTDIDDLVDDDYTLRLTEYTGRRYDLSMLGKAYGQIAAEVANRRRDRLQHDLLLTGIGEPKAFPGATFTRGGEPERAELRLFDDLLVIMPDHGLMWGLPYSFIDSVHWDDTSYRVRVTDDQGVTHEFGWLAKRSEEFAHDVRAKLDELARRTARTLAGLIPGVEPDALSRLAAAMRDGRAVQQRIVDAIDPSLWPRLEGAVITSKELRTSYDALKAMTPAGWAALGVKASQAETSDLPDVEPAKTADRRGQPDGEGGAQDVPPPEHGEGQKSPATLWYFCPLAKGGRPINAVAQEVTSESGHATYVFRLMDRQRFAEAARERDRVASEVGVAVARLNRALLTLNLRREPIYLPEDQLTSGRFTRYAVALRKLEYLRSAREAFLGRAIHTDEATWRSQLDTAIARA